MFEEISKNVMSSGCDFAVGHEEFDINMVTRNEREIS
jgi:hypothetical protein